MTTLLQKKDMEVSDIITKQDIDEQWFTIVSREKTFVTIKNTIKDLAFVLESLPEGGKFKVYKKL